MIFFIAIMQIKIKKIQEELMIFQFICLIRFLTLTKKIDIDIHAKWFY